MKEIKKIKNLSLANITAAIYGLAGFFVALGIAIFVMANIIIQGDFGGSVLLVTLFNVGTGILLGLVVAVITACWGWFIGLVTSALYNMFARRLGGIKIELVEGEEKAEKESEKNANKEEESREEGKSNLNY